QVPIPTTGSCSPVDGIGLFIIADLFPTRSGGVPVIAINGFVNAAMPAQPARLINSRRDIDGFIDIRFADLFWHYLNYSTNLLPIPNNRLVFYRITSYMQKASAISGTPKEQLTLTDAIALIVGLVIGAGIFRTPSLVAANTDTNLFFFLTWIAGGTLSII